ncbi:unnamed protein product [Lactuca saligna]|uniref:Uncharacterized protein n=1 Tax=Lactuca saligna TaxID=75948 RepID=A0AA36EIX4_LACSI|nr:unnamed protein product [Lactuca saligna]
MEVDKEQHEDIPDFNTEYELDDGNQEYDSHTENGENEDIHYNSQSDSEEEIHKTVPTKSHKKRGMTRLPKLKTEYVNSGGKKRVRFDEFGRFTGKNNAVFVSYLGDLFREKVGLSAHCWKKVKPEMKDKLWEEITRYFEVHESGKQFVMNRLGILLRNFRRKLCADYIKPHLGDTDIEENVISKEEIPPSKGSSKEEIKDLKVALHNGKLELEKKDAELKALSTKVNEQDQTLKLVLAHLNEKGVDFPNLSHTIGILSEKIVQSNETSHVSLKTNEPSKPVTLVIPKPNKKPVQTKSATAALDAKLISMKSAIANTKTTNKTVESKTTTINHDIPKVSPNNPIHQVPEIISHQKSTKRKSTYISSDALLKKTRSNRNKKNA